MLRSGLIALVSVVLIAGLALATPAQAALVHTIKLLYWPANFSDVFTPGGTVANWNTGFWGVDYRLEGPPQPWGFHFQYASGSESGWSGPATVGITSGTDRIWSADGSYRWQTPMLTARAFLGYGSLQWRPAAGAGFAENTWSGWRIGGDLNVPIGTTNWSANAAVAWYPSATLTVAVPGASATNPNSQTASDWSVSIQYTNPTTPKWLAELGYRSATANCSGPATFCTPLYFNSSGWFIAGGIIWP